MPEFHVGDTVVITSPRARVERMASFEITEFKEWEGQLCATGDGHAWWPVEMLDCDMTVEQKELAIKLERALNDFRGAERYLEMLQQQAMRELPEPVLDRICDAYQAGT